MAEINLHPEHPEGKFLLQVQEAGWRIRCHQPFEDYPEKVRQHIATWLQGALFEITKDEKGVGVVGSVASYLELLTKVNPNVSFYEREAYNYRTDRKEAVREFKIHDTEDRQIFNALGKSLEDLYVKLKILTPIEKTSTQKRK